MRVFGMITTVRSAVYTRPAMESFFQHTELSEDDLVILVDNDHSLERRAFEEFPVTVVKNDAPLGFAANANQLMRIASELGADLYLLNNDIIFTDRWLTFLDQVPEGIVAPLSNAELPYKLPNFELAPTMSLEQFVGNEEDLNRIVAAHQKRHSGLRSVHTIPFFCVKIPQKVYSVVGELDETFGVGGAEDRDYAVRVLLAGFKLSYALGAFVLHFQGRSTWRGGESVDETNNRNQRYTRVFKEKWGDPLLRLFILQDERVLEEMGIKDAFAKQDFKNVIEALAKNRHTNILH